MAEGSNPSRQCICLLILLVWVCRPLAPAQRGPAAPGNHPGGTALHDLVQEAGFTRWQCLTETLGKARCARQH